MNIKTVYLAVIYTSVAAFCGSVYAGQDAKVWPGSACQFKNPQQIIFEPDASFALDNGKIKNVSSQIAEVVCPVVRDNVNNTNGTVAVTVRVLGSLGKNVACKLNSRDRFGKSIDFSANIGGADEPKSIALDVEKSALSGSYDLSCGLPPDGQVLTYQVTEFTPTVEQE